MIAHLHGTLTSKTVEHIVIDVHGVGYGVTIPLSTYYTLPQVQEPVRLLTTLHVREDVMRLYGFATQDERVLFELLTSVSSIGPRLALNMLSSIPAPELRQTIAQSDVTRLQTIPGIGRKTAERVVLELKEKVDRITLVAAVLDSGVTTDGADHLVGDVVSALLNLGYKRLEAEKAVKAVRTAANGNLTLERLLKDALQQLGR